MENKTLYHHGVKGMKWGVRKDKKSGGSSGKGRTVKRKIVKSQDALEYEALKKKKREELSNEELRKVNNRGKLIQENKKINPGTIAKGILIASAAITVIGTVEKLHSKTKPYIDAGVKAGKRATNNIIDSFGDHMVTELNAGLKNLKI